MIDHIAFGQIHSIWPVIVGSVCLWGLFIWKEWTGIVGPRFYLKILAALFAIVALAMMALKPMIRTVEKTTYTGILSSGYQNEQRDSLKTVYKSLKFIDYKPGKDLSGNLEKGQEVFILGHGLAAYDLWQLNEVKVHRLPAVSPVGISRLKYTQENIVGNDLIVEGEYHKAINKHQLVLMGPGELPLDSVQLRPVENQRFSLSTKHLVAGKFIYTIVEKDSLGNQSSVGPLAVKIRTKKKLNILMVNQFPSFETKYLKNFLAESGHGVMVRSQVSKDRYKYEYFNIPQKPIGSLNSKTLSEVDLLIIDIATLQKSSKNTLERLRTAITKQGLGLFIQGDATSFNSGVSLLDLEFLKQEDVEVTFENHPKTPLTKYPYVVKNEVRLESVERSEKGIITAYKKTGAGRIGTTVLQNTYELLLKGKTEVYQNIWSATISAISKRTAQETVWNKDELMVYRDAPFHFKIKTTQENPEVSSMEGYRIPLAQNIDFAQQWTGTTFPQKDGWNTLLLRGDSTEVLDFYVIDTAQWASLEAFKRIRENKRYVNDRDSIEERAVILQPIQPWWFFIIFLAAMAFLWLEPKL